MQFEKGELLFQWWRLIRRCCITLYISNNLSHGYLSQGLLFVTRHCQVTVTCGCIHIDFLLLIDRKNSKCRIECGASSNLKLKLASPCTGLGPRLR